MEQNPRHARIRDAVESATTTAVQVQEFAHNAKYFYDQANHAHQNIPYAPGGRTFLGTIIPLIKKTIYYTAYGIILSTTSMAMYAIFYCLVMPEHYATEPIFFDYNYKSCGSAVCPPTAVVDLVSLNTQWKAHVPDVIHFPEGNGQQVCHHEGQGSDDNNIDMDEAECKVNHQLANRILQPKQTYFFQVALTLPESSKNRDIGMFMIESVLKSKVQKATNRNSSEAEANLIENGELRVQEQELELKTLATSSRPAMLPYQSAYVSSVKKSFIMIPLILEAVPEARTVVIECFDHFRESTEYPMNYVEIRLVIPRNSYGINDGGMRNGNGNELLENVQVWKAELRIGKELNRIQRLMTEWFYTSACVGIIFFVFLQIIMWSCFKLWMHGLLKFVKETVNEQIRQSDLRNGNGNGNGMHDYEGGDDFSDGFSYLDLSAGGASGSGASILGPRGSHVSVNASYFDQDDSSQWETTSMRKSDESDLAEEANSAVSINDGTPENTSKTNQHAQVQDQHAQVQDISNNRDSSDPKRENSRTTNAGAIGNSGGGSGNGNNKKKRKKKKKKLSSNKSELRPNQTQQAPSSQTTTEEERIMAERVMKGDFQRYEVFTGEWLSNM